MTGKDCNTSALTTPKNHRFGADSKGESQHHYGGEAGSSAWFAGHPGTNRPHADTVSHSRTVPPSEGSLNLWFCGPVFRRGACAFVSVFQDLRFGLRNLRNNPGFASVPAINTYVGSRCEHPSFSARSSNPRDRFGDVGAGGARGLLRPGASRCEVRSHGRAENGMKLKTRRHLDGAQPLVCGVLVGVRVPKQALWSLGELDCDRGKTAYTLLESGPKSRPQ